MKAKRELIKSFKRNYFWDLERSNPDSEISDRLIIERIFTLGDPEEMKLVINYFGETRTVELLLSLNYLDPKTLNFVSKLFNKPRKLFKCYIRKQSMPQLWN
jgi:hypothetical protein